MLVSGQTLQWEHTFWKEQQETDTRVCGFTRRELDGNPEIPPTPEDIRDAEDWPPEWRDIFDEMEPSDVESYFSDDY